MTDRTLSDEGTNARFTVLEEEHRHAEATLAAAASALDDAAARNRDAAQAGATLRAERDAAARRVAALEAELAATRAEAALERVVDDNSSLLPPPTPADLQPSFDSYVDGQRP